MKQSNEDIASYAGFWIRCLSLLLDLTICVLPVFLISIMLILFLSITEIPVSVPVKELLKNLHIQMSVLAFAIYYTILSAGKMQSTIGEKICGIIIGNTTDGSRINLGKAFLRFIFLYFAFELLRISLDTTENNERLILSAGLLLILIVNTLIFITKDKAVMHDYLLKARVFTKERLSFQRNPLYFLKLVLMIIILWGALVPLFKLKVSFFAIWVSVIILMLAIIWYVKNQHSRSKLSNFEVKNFKKLLLSAIPSIVLYVVVYSVLLYLIVIGQITT